MKKLKFIFTYSVVPLLVVSCANTVDETEDVTKVEATPKIDTPAPNKPVQAINPNYSPQPPKIVYQSKPIQKEEQTYTEYRPLNELFTDYELPENFVKPPSELELKTAPSPESLDSETVITPMAP